MILTRGSGFRCVLVLLALAFFSTAAFAQATRTWVSGVGDDANPCSRTAPCKTFAGAISKTGAGGIINALDPAGYGAVTITKSITIDGGGVYGGGILHAGTSGILVNAAATDVVRIRNLTIDGVGLGLNGIKFQAGAALHVENVRIYDNSAASPNGYGILFTPTAVSQLVVTDSLIGNNKTGGGIYISPGASGQARVSISGTRLIGNSQGLRANGRSIVAMRDCVVAGSVNSGVLAVGSSTQISEVTVENCQIVNNGATNPSSSGVYAAGALGVLRIGNNVITGNAYGIRTDGAGSVLSFGNNRIDGNTNDGNPTGTVAQK